MGRCRVTGSVDGMELLGLQVGEEGVETGAAAFHVPKDRLFTESVIPWSEPAGAVCGEGCSAGGTKEAGIICRTVAGGGAVRQMPAEPLAVIGWDEFFSGRTGCDCSTVGPMASKASAAAWRTSGSVSCMARCKAARAFPATGPNFANNKAADLRIRDSGACSARITAGIAGCAAVPIPSKAIRAANRTAESPQRTIAIKLGTASDAAGP